jgi:hypothetical protein
MFRLSLGQQHRSCDGVSRRHVLRLGTCGLISGLTLPRLLELQAKAAATTNARAKSCIFLFLEGGPPHQDMWDPKPDAPPEIRGPFEAIRTNIPGTYVTDQLPLCAKIADKYTILRSHSHRDNAHSTGYHYVMTGRRANFADGDNPVPNNDFYPSIGSVVSRVLGQRGALPPYVNLPHPMAGGGPGFYGAEHAPFVIEADPTQPDFEVKDLQPAAPLYWNRSVRARAKPRPSQGHVDVLRKSVQLDHVERSKEGVRHSCRTGFRSRRVWPNTNRSMCVACPTTCRRRLPFCRRRRAGLGCSLQLFSKFEN